MNYGFFKSFSIIFLLICSANVASANTKENKGEQPTKAQENDLIHHNLQKQQEDEGWMGDLHRTVSNSVYQSAFWFDSFFTNDDTEQQKPTTNARIRLSWEPKSRDLGEFNTRFRVKVKLPHFKDKVDVILSDDVEDDLNSLPLDRPSINPDKNEEHFAAAVRYIVKKESDKITDTRIGITGGDIFVRARHRRNLTWKENHGFKIEPAVYYFLDDGLGAKLLLEYDYQVKPTQQIRFNYSIRGSESFSGIKWKHGLYNLNQLSQNTATIFGLQVEGERNGDRGFVIDKYTLSYRYRFNALKKWLFFEIEPFVEWPEKEDYSTTPGIALRVEGFFYRNN